MNIDAKFFSAIIFLIVQTCGAIWWASGLSSEVERLAGDSGTRYPSFRSRSKATAALRYIISRSSQGTRKKVARICEESRCYDIPISRLLKLCWIRF